MPCKPEQHQSQPQGMARQGGLFLENRLDGAENTAQLVAPDFATAEARQSCSRPRDSSLGKNFRPRDLPDTKRAIGVSVYEAAVGRIKRAFDSFRKVYVSFSAGKDSTVMLHMVAREAKRRGRSFGVLLIDLEAQYKLTIEHALSCRYLYQDCSRWFWVCLPISLRNAVSM